MADARTLPPPPRLTGTAQNDLVAMSNYQWDFYNINRQLPSDVEAEDGGDTVLPDPAGTTLAQAQTTANQAYNRAVAAQAGADAAAAVTAGWEAGTATVAEAATSFSITFATEQPDTDYTLMLTASDFSGSPAAGARQPTKQTKTTTGCTVDVSAAPGAGTSVTFTWHLRRAPATTSTET